MRVIAGRLRSRKLHAPTGADTRPTHDRVKEALFSVLGDIRGARVVDLYAGTGALGIEALSRGASHACFVERARGALDCLRRNLSELGLVPESTVLARGVESSGSELTRLGPHDLIFCDPPWARMADVVALLGRLSMASWLAADGVLILEHPARIDAAQLVVAGLTATDSRRWGDTAVSLYSPAPSGEASAEMLRS
jgi:16S rRNA (guanine966-N2)-methyltransferase